MVGIAQTIDFLPWCVKFVWAIPSDTFNFFGFGHRRPYIVLGLTLAACAFSALILFDPGKFIWAYMICMIMRNIGIALADCAINGLSVDCDMDTEAGAISGWMSLGRTIGTVVAAISAGIIAKDSYAMAILASSALLFFPLPATIYIKEEWVDEKAFEDKIETAAAAMAASAVKAPSAAPAAAAAQQKQPLQLTDAGAAAGAGTGASGASAASVGTDGAPLTEEEAKKKIKRRQSFIAKVATSAGFDWDMLEELLGRRHVWLFLVYLGFTTLGLALANFSLTAWCHETKGFGIDEVGILMSVMSIGCFVVSLPMGYIFDLVPSKRSLMFVAAACMGGANLFLVFANSRLEVYLGLFLFGAAHGVVYVVQCSMARILADMRIAAAFFGLVDSICNLMHAFGTAFGGPIAERASLEMNFVVGAAVDFFALFFCLLLPEEALRFSHADVFDGKAKVLPHRVNLQFAQARKTALNTELRMLEARREELADAEEASAAAGGAAAYASALAAKGPLVKLALIAEAARAGKPSPDEADEADGVAVLREPHEVLQMLHAVPAYVPMAHLAASARTGALAATDDGADGAAGFINPLAAAQAANLSSRGLGGGGAAGVVGRGSRRPSLYERASTMLEEASAPPTRAPRPVAPAQQGFSLAYVLSALGLPGGAPSAGSSQGRRADALAGGRALRRSSVAASIVDRLGVVGVGMGASDGGAPEAFDEASRRGRAGGGGGGARSGGTSASPSRAVRNPLAAAAEAAAAAAADESGSDDTGDVTEEAAAAGADHAEPQNFGDPAPPMPPPPPPRQSSRREARNSGGVVGGGGGSRPDEAPAVSTSSATSAAAFAQARRKRLEQMGAAAGGAAI